MSMDLRLLRYLVVTAREGSANRAAAVLHMTQPSLSRQLRELERRTGLVLFERSGRHLRLSRSGDQLVDMARELLAHADRMDRAVTAMASGRIDEIRLAVPATTLTDVLAPFIATMGRDEPALVARELDPRGAAAALDSGADFAVVVHRPEGRLWSRMLATLPVWAYVPSGDIWADRDEFSLEELVTRPLIVMEETFRPRRALDSAIDRAGLAYESARECMNAQVAQALAAGGHGVALVSDDPRFGLVPLRVRDGDHTLQVDLYAAWNPRHHAAELLQELAERISEFCVRRYGPTAAPEGQDAPV